MVQRVGERENAIAADATPGRLNSAETAGSGRKPDRSSRVAAKASVAKPQRRCDTGSGRGGANPVTRVPRIKRGRHFRVVRRVRALRHLQLSEDDRRSVFKAVHNGGVEGWSERLENRRPRGSRSEGRVAEVLDGDWHAVERAAPEAAGDLRVCGFRLLKRAFRQHGRVGLILP